ncbi:MAG: DUF4411 family protein [Brumimicrobium sp.]
MIFIFDTSSFVSLARYYLPFDSNQKIYEHFKRSLESGRIILIDGVLEECRYVSKKIVVQKLDFLEEKEFLKKNNLPLNTKDLIPAAPRKFYNMVDNNFTTPVVNQLSEIQFEQLKKEYLASADGKMVLYAFNEKHGNPDTALTLVTEESSEANDNKAFKKLPAICKQLSIRSMNLPEYMRISKDIDINFG